MNNNILNYLQNEINENKISHAFLVETNNCEQLEENICNLLKNNNIISKSNILNNPNVYIIQSENNIIDKNKVLDLQKFIFTKSVTSNYKIYFIINAELMNLSSFNKLLKILEEPNDNVIGFLLTIDQSKIIPTIKSRCKRFRELYDIAHDNKDNFEIISKLLNYLNLSFEDIINLKKEILKYSKEDIINIMTEFKNQLIINNKNQDLTSLAKSYKILDNIIVLIKSNVNLELCLDKMFIEMRK